MTALRLLAAALVLHLILAQPNHPAALTWQTPMIVALELPVLLALFAALPARHWATTWARGAFTLIVAAIALQKLADFAMFTAFNRGFNPLVDMPLAVAGWRLGSGAVGLPLAVLALLAGLLAIVACALVFWWALGQWAALRLPRGMGAPVLGIAGLGTLLVGAEVGHRMGAWSLPATPPGTAFTTRVAVERAATLRQTWRDLGTFAKAAEQDPMAGRAGLLDRIGQRDVLLTYVESYGRASLDGPLYAPTHRATLRQAEPGLRRAGYSLRSAWLRAPIVGGQSWLSHATLASGLRIGDQSRYGALLASGRRTLFHMATEAGFESLAIMPAITLNWPEARPLGFTRVLDAAALNYAGRPYNWVTMPDQFTLRAVEQARAAATAPLFAQIALISSHAPWVPIPPMVGWEAINDGRIFDQWADDGDPPEVVWRDHDRVRAAYRSAVDYSLTAALSFAARQADDPPLIVLLGDHPAAGFVSQSDSFDVPIHIIGPPELVARIEDWGWQEGLIPDGAPVWPMAAFRDRFLDAFSSGPAG